jgi:hypothetical protein
LKRKRNILQDAFLKSDLSSFRIVLVVQSKRKQEEKIRKEIKEKEREREKKEKNLLFHLSCKAEREVQG